MELEFKTDEETGFCFTICPFIEEETIMINSFSCNSCDNNYGVTDVGKLRCKGNRDGKN